MKRLMTTSTFVVASLVGALGFSSVAAQEAAGEEGAMEEAMEEVAPAPMSHTLYGSVRSGVERVDPDNGDSAWDIGKNFGSLLGIKGSADLGNGLTVGYKLERGVAESNLGQRFHYVDVKGAFGTVTLGRQPSPYRAAQTWDGSYWLGGAVNTGGDKISGVSYASDLGGPFNFKALVADDNRDTGGGDGADILEVSGSFTAGPIDINVGYADGARAASKTLTRNGKVVTDADDMEEADRLGDRFAVTVGGEFTNISAKVGYEDGSEVDTCTMDGMTKACDSEKFGFHLGYGIGDGNVYAQYGEEDSDNNMSDSDYWLVGYAHQLGSGVVLYAEHREKDDMVMRDMMMKEESTGTTVMVLRVDF